MCGLFSYLSFSDRGIQRSIVERATQTMQHRGPDDHGFAFVTTEGAWQWKDDVESRVPDQLSDGLFMGHQRLSILDLSDKGHQPFVSADGRYWMVFNGEIYNYIELRAELQKAGYSFNSGTDTEVAFRAYMHWGDDCFVRFNGMWAIVIWDRQENLLVASRDPFGIKPLHYVRLGADWAFASECRALLQLPGVSAAPSDESIRGFIAQYRAPLGDETFYENVKQLIPGVLLKVRREGTTSDRFWHPNGSAKARYRDEGEALEDFRELFASSVSMRLRSDVRVGTMVSGGLDSTSVIYQMHSALTEGNPDAASLGRQLQGFNASFEGLEIDEADQVNELMGCLDLNTHFVRPLEVANIPELYHHAVGHMDGPYFNSVPVVNRLLMQRARSEGVKVVLNGHGSDEQFAGFPARYNAPMIAFYLKRGDLINAFRQYRGMRDLMGLSSYGVLHQLLPYRMRPHTWVKGIGPDQVRLLRRSPSKQNADSSAMSQRSQLDRLLKHDFYHHNMPKWLWMEDRMSMSESVESRLPFLDPRLVEFTFDLHESLKIRNGRTKYLLRKAMQHKLPQSIVVEKKKKFFSGPDAQWLSDPLRPTVEQLLFERTPLVDEYVDTKVLRREYEDMWNGKRTMVTKLWSIFAVEYWLEHFT